MRRIETTSSAALTRRNLQKYLRYGFEQKSFAPDFGLPPVTQTAIDQAAVIRGKERPAAIIIHGIMPRAGTVFAGELLRLHPDVVAYPRGFWEFPLLQQAQRLSSLQEEFLWSYEQNMDKIGERDFLPLVGAAVIAHLYAEIQPGKRMLLKVPSVQYLQQFYDVFPHEQLLVLVRDGRDVVQSTVRTWPQLRFSMVAKRYDRAAKMVKVCDEAFRQRESGYWQANFEDAVADPEAFARAACERFGLNVDRFPFEQVKTLKVRGSSQISDEGRVSWDPKPKSKEFNPVGHWRSWPEQRKWLFKHLAGNSLIELGYAGDQRW